MDMDGYLLDTNVVTAWWRKDPKVLARIAALPKDSPLLMSLVSMGEVEYGHRVEAPAGRTPIQAEYEEFIRGRLPHLIGISGATTQCYGDLRAKLFIRFASGEKRKKPRLPEQLVDPAAARELGIQENDLWIAAQAVERNLVLVTHDAIARIREVAGELRVEDWMAQELQPRTSPSQA